MTDVQVTQGEARGVERAIRLVDCDVHPVITPPALYARMSSRWRRHLEEFGSRVAGPLAIYPRMRGGGSRLDARPPDGGIAGSDLGLVQSQLLDEYGVDFAVLNLMQAQGFGMEAPEFAA